METITRELRAELDEKEVTISSLKHEVSNLQVNTKEFN